MTPDYDYGAQANCELHLFFIFLRLCSYYITVIIKKLKLCLLVVLILVKIKYGHPEISVPTIGVPISKTASIKPWVFSKSFSFKVHCSNLTTISFFVTKSLLQN